MGWGAGRAAREAPALVEVMGRRCSGEAAEALVKDCSCLSHGLVLEQEFLGPPATLAAHSVASFWGFCRGGPAFPCGLPRGRGLPLGEA